MLKKIIQNTYRMQKPEEQILKSHRKKVGHTPKWKNNPEDILTEPTTPKHTINIHNVNQNTSYTQDQSITMLKYIVCLFLSWGLKRKESIFTITCVVLF